MPDRDDNFLARWSRRKHEARHGGVRVPDAEATGDADARSDTAPDLAKPPDTPATDASDAPEPVLDDLRNIDFSKLDATSDYTRFMHKDVPSDIRSKALAKLWTSDPVLAKPEELTDYAGDYTDAAMAVSGGALRTAYKVGRGFLSDEELAQWENLGKPAQTASPAMADATVLLPGFLVRPCTPADAEALREVRTAALMGTEHASDEPANPTRDEVCELTLEQSSGRIVAFCCTKADAVCGLYVHPDFARGGIASALLARAEGAIAKSGHVMVRLTASEPAAAFFARHGYQRLRDRQQPTGGAPTLVEMQKQIA